MGLIEGHVGLIKRGIEKLLADGTADDPYQAACQMVAAHNELDRHRGYSPNQWAVGSEAPT
eukprot:12651635-Alexandrium_andersonii.AAC.1